MSVYKRGNVWWCEFEVNKQRIRKSTGEAGKRKAQEFERKLRLDLAEQFYHDRTQQSSQKTYGEAVLKWMPTAPDSMRSHIRNTLPYLENLPLVAVPSAAYEMSADMLKRGLSSQTVNRRLACVRRVLNLAFREWDWIEKPLAQKISLLSERNTERNIALSSAEVDVLLSHVNNPIAKSMLYLMAYTGLRKSEIRALEPEDWKPPYLYVRKSKSGKPRRVPVIDELHSMVQLPFKLSAHRLRKEFEIAREAIERPEIRMHDLRHSFGTWLAEDEDIPIAEIRNLLGHSSLAVTSRYVNIRDDNYALVSKSLGKKKKKPTH